MAAANQFPEKKSTDTFTGQKSPADKAVKDGELPAFTSFEDMGLRENLLHGVFAFGFESPSAVQMRAIVPWASGKDVLVQAQSGTGKTATFLLGLLQQIDVKSSDLQAIVLAPTRELAEQIAGIASDLGTFDAVRVRACVGGKRLADDLSAFRRREVQIVVATPGRLLHLIRESAIDPATVGHIAIDEADQMLDLGFDEDVRALFNALPKDAQAGFFSATMPDEMVRLADTILKQDKISVRVATEKLSLSGISQFYVYLERDDWKLETLSDLYETISVSQSVIFVNSRRRCEEVAEYLTSEDHSVAMIHGDMSPRDRTLTMRDFRNGSARVLIATDVLARGVDVHGVSCVINFELPPRDAETYLHRIGRSGRFGRKGIAINLVSPRDANKLRQLEQYFHLAISEMPGDIAEYFQ